MMRVTITARPCPRFTPLQAFGPGQKKHCLTHPSDLN